MQLRLLAPFLPYVTEEVWSWWRDGSIHLAPWPTEVDLGSAAAADPAMVDAVAAALIGIRGAKSAAKVSMRAELSRVEITGPEALVRAAEQAAGDLRGDRQDHRQAEVQGRRVRDRAVRRRRAGRVRLRS